MKMNGMRANGMMTNGTGRYVASGICLIAALASAAYGVHVWAAHSGTGFWMIWLAIACIFVVAGLSAWFGWWKAMPKAVRRVCAAVLCVALICFGTVEGLVISGMGAAGEPGLDYVIVLGAQVHRTRPSLVLKYRLDKTIDYLESNPDTVCIVSGGKGANEPFPEAQGMADYLERHGIAKSRIIRESKSEDTRQNIANSRRLITKRDASIGIITSDFHVFRALQIARDQGLADARGIASGSPGDMLANNMLREFFAEIKYLVKR